MVKLKTVFRSDRLMRKFRLFRLIWNKGVVGDGKGYSACLSVGLVPRFFFYYRDSDGWRFCLCGMRFHFSKAYGGYHV